MINGNNVYIGARYVPIFDGEWDTGKAYEPLVIVQNAGDSYTSKTYVPIGIEISNEEYWVKTGNYNAQLEAYAQAVNTLSQNYNVINDSVNSLTGLQLKNKKCYFFGDSITQGVITGGKSPVIAEKPYPEIFGEITGANVINKGKAGSRCTNTGNYVNFQTVVANTDLSDADYVFICYGYNDMAGNVEIGNDNSGMTYFRSALITNINAIKNKMKAECVIVLLTLPPNKYDINEIETMTRIPPERFNRCITDIAEKMNIQCINFTDGCGINSLNYAALTQDQTHFNQNGYTILGRGIAHCIESGQSHKNMYSSGENMFYSEMFYNDFSVSTNFNSYSDIMLHPTNEVKQISTNQTVLIESGKYYSISFDIYNDVDYSNYPDNYMNAVFTLYTNSTPSINPYISKPCVGVTHVEIPKFKAKVSGSCKIAIIVSTDMADIGTLAITNLTMCEGSYPTLAKPVNSLFVLMNAENWTNSNITGLYQNLPGIFSYRNGLLYYSFGIITNDSIRNGTELGTIPTNLIYRAYGRVGAFKYMIGLDQATGAAGTVVLNLVNSKITAGRTLPAGQWLFTGVLPINFN